MLRVNDGGDPAAELAAVETFAALRLPGMITPVSDLVVDRLVRHRIHVARADRVVNTQRAGAVVSANDAGGPDGDRARHHRIALLIDGAAWTTGAGRLAGCRTAHQAANMPVDEDLVILAGFDAARTAVASLLDRWPDVTAVLAAYNCSPRPRTPSSRSGGSVCPRRCRSSPTTTCRGCRWSAPQLPPSPSTPKTSVGAVPICSEPEPGREGNRRTARRSATASR